MFEDKIFKDFSGNIYNHNEFLSLLGTMHGKGYSVCIGTDSQVFRTSITTVTAICCHKQGFDGGSKIFYIKDVKIIDHSISFRARMMNEAFQSLEVAMNLEPTLSRDFSIHIDVGTTDRSDSSKFHKEIRSMIISQGYKCELKPDSWAASAAADRIARLPSEQV